MAIPQPKNTACHYELVTRVLIVTENGPSNFTRSKFCIVGYASVNVAASFVVFFAAPELALKR